MPTASFGLPVYNGERFLRQTLEEILGQTFSDFELIVSDNASSDRTPQILAEFARRDSRIRVLRQAKNIGAVQNFDAVCRAASGRFFAWVGDHDLRDRRWLEACVDELQAHPNAVLVYPWYRGISYEGEELYQYLHSFDTVGMSAWRRVEAVTRMRGVGSRIYGCFRLAAMRRVRVHPCAWWDRLYLTSLAAHGEFVQVERVLWSRRHADFRRELDETGLAVRMLQHQFRTVHAGGRVPVHCRIPTLWHLACLVSDLAVAPPDGVYTPARVAVGVYAAMKHLGGMRTNLLAEMTLAFRGAAGVSR